MDHPAAALAPLALVGVLVVSGLAKLDDPESTRSVITLLRLPGPLRVPWVARALPVGELVLAAALLGPRPAFTAAGVVAVVLFAAYWVVIARALTFDPRPTCGCFGRIGDQRVAGRTLVRNTILLALAAWTLALGRGGDSVWSLTGRFTTGDWLWLGGAVVAAALAVLVTGAASGPAHRPRVRDADGAAPAPADEHPPGTADEDDGLLDYVRAPIPRATLRTGDGRMRTLHELVRDRAALLAFVTCGCGSTSTAVGALEGWRERMPALEVHLVSTLEPATARASGIPLPPDTLYDHAGLCFEALGCRGNLCAVLLGADGQLAGGPVTGTEETMAFVDEIAAVLADAGPRGPAEEQLSDAR